MLTRSRGRRRKRDENKRSR